MNPDLSLQILPHPLQMWPAKKLLVSHAIARICSSNIVRHSTNTRALWTWCQGRPSVKTTYPSIHWRHPLPPNGHHPIPKFNHNWSWAGGIRGGYKRLHNFAYPCSKTVLRACQACYWTVAWASRDGGASVRCYANAGWLWFRRHCCVQRKRKPRSFLSDFTKAVYLTLACVTTVNRDGTSAVYRFYPRPSVKKRSK